jgi:hypothetical protein
MIFAVSFEIIIQQAVGNESCYPMKNTLIIIVLSNRSRKYSGNSLSNLKRQEKKIRVTEILSCRKYTKNRRKNFIC